MQIELIHSPLESDNTSLFSSKSWLIQFDQKRLKHYRIQEGQEALAYFSIYIGKLGPFTYISTTPFSPFIPFDYNSKAQNKAKVNAYHKKIYRSFCDFLLKTYPFAIFSIPLPHHIVDTQVFFWNKFKIIPQYTYVLNLVLGIESIRSGFTPEKRNEIKKAVKDGVYVKESKDRTELMMLIQKTFDRKNENIPIDILKKILFVFSKPDNSFTLVAYNQQDQPIASSHYIYDSKQVYYLLSGYDPALKHSGAGSLMLDTALEKSVQMGKVIFDFEGSMLPEVEKFVRDFGGDQQVYYRINKAPMLLEMGLKLFKREFF